MRIVRIAEYQMPHSTSTRKPGWLKARRLSIEQYGDFRYLLGQHRLHTVCRSACCPNIATCWGNRTATFLILGDRCTRNCRFCAVTHGLPKDPDRDEPARVAKAVEELSMDYVVITSVTRDDLEDGGAGAFADTVRAIRERCPECRVEVLIPDFAGNLQALDTTLEARPDVVSHNVETVPRLYPSVRPGAAWDRSLALLRHAKESGFIVKTGLMLGLGETRAELIDAFSELVQLGVAILTLGQYLAPTRRHCPVARFLTPDEFKELREQALALGFRNVVSGPLVRSSYRAKKAFRDAEQSATLPSSGAKKT